MAQFFYKTIVGGIVAGTLLAVVLAADPEILLDPETAYSWGLENPSSLGGFIGNLFWVYFLLLFLMICTGGVGLIILIPVGYGVGWVVFALADAVEFHLGLKRNEEFQTKSAEARQQPEPVKSTVQSLTERLNQELRNDPALNRNQSALLNYIKKARNKGLNDAQISRNLTHNGWPTDSITAAFQMVGNG